MTGYRRQVLAAVALLTVGGLVPACGGDEEKKGDHEIWFMGSIYDGATGGIITGYDITLVSGPTTINGKVDGNGRYTLGPLKAWNDYAVTISHPDYRAFVSYNSGIAPPARPPATTGSTTTTNITADDIYSANTTQTFDFDAYLFPNRVQAPALTVSIVKTDASPTPADGSIRLRPTGLPIIQDQASGVSGQVWANDQDMLANVYSNDFTGGSITVDAGTLVYGVNYAVVVYNVAGYQPTSGTLTVRAGFQDSLIVNISTAISQLVMVSSNMAQCRPFGQSTNVIRTAEITFTFNTPIDDVTTTTGKGPEVIDANLTASTSMGALLKTNSSSLALERATSFVLNGSALTIYWNPSMGLTSVLSGDLIQNVNYSGFASIMLQPTGHPELAKSLAALTGLQSYLCYM